MNEYKPMKTLPKTEKVPITQGSEKDTNILKEYDKLSLWAFGIAISFILPLMGFLSLLASPITVILSIKSLRRIERSEKKLKGKGLAIAALIIGCFEILILISAILILSLIFNNTSLDINTVVSSL